MKNCATTRRHRRGLLVMDAVVGIVMALLLLMLMTAAVIKQTRREKELTDIRTAARAAESAMILLQSNQPLPAGVNAQPLSAEATPNLHWVRITATYNGHTSSLLGLVNADAAKKIGGTP